MTSPMAEQVNLPAYSPHCLFYAKSRCMEAVNANFKVIGLTQLRIKLKSTAPEGDAFTYWSPELLK